MARRLAKLYIMKSPLFLGAFSCFVLALDSGFSPAYAHIDSDVSAAAVQEALQPEFIPPPPGTYRLPAIDTINDHQLLDSTGRLVGLFELMEGKITIVSFMYTSCAEVGGCPLAAAVLQQLDQLLATRPELAKQVTLVSLSFDVERDRPERLAEIRAGVAPRTTWHFLTAPTPEEIQAVLGDFHQPVAKLWNADGSWSGLFRHVLKVYLLDAHHQVRNIYSTGLFNAQLVLNDIETILMGAEQQHPTRGQP